MSGRDPNETSGGGASDAPDPPRDRLVQITLDEKSISRANANIVHEREVAIYDILEANHFAVEGRDDGPYTLDLAISEDRLVFTIGTPGQEGTFTVMMALSSLRKTIKDYFIVCDSYYQAIRNAPPSRIQTIDMGRRALHDDGSRILIERLTGKLALDHETGRRLFTLICALHWKG